jgi:hypothetical protein
MPIVDNGRTLCDRRVERTETQREHHNQTYVIGSA